MPTLVEIPNIGNVEFPDGMTPRQIQDVIETEIIKTRQPADPYAGGDVELGRILGPQLDPAEAQRRNELAQLQQVAREAPFRDVVPIPDIRPQPAGPVSPEFRSSFAYDPIDLRTKSSLTGLTTGVGDEATTAAPTHPSLGQRIKDLILPESTQDELDRMRRRRIAEFAAEPPSLQVVHQALEGALNTAMFGLSPQMTPAPEGTAQEISRGAGSLAGFIIGGPAKVGHAARETTLLRELTPYATDPRALQFAKGVARESATLATMFAAAGAGGALDEQTMAGFGKRLLEEARQGAEVGAVFGAAGRAIPGNEALPRLARIATVNAALDLMQGTRPWDERDLAQKAFDYGVNTFFAFRGTPPSTALPGEAARNIAVEGRGYGVRAPAGRQPIQPPADAPQVPEPIDNRVVSVEPVSRETTAKTTTAIPQRENVPLRTRTAAQWATELPGMPQGIYEALAKVPSNELGATQERQLQELRSRISEKGQNPAEAVRNVWGAELTDAPQGLRQALKNILVVPELPSRTPSVRIPRLPPRVGSQPTAPEAPGKTIAPVQLSQGERRVILPDGGEISARLGVVEADSIVASQLPSGAENPAYPKELQPRDRSRAASQIQISGMAQNLRPELLGDTGKAGDGAPIIGPDGVVESGNARSVAIQRAYGTPRGDEYKRWLIDNAERFGLDRNQIQTMRAPVLVRQRTTSFTPEQRADFTRRANQPEVAPMSPSETARADAARLSDRDLDLLRPSEDGDLLAASNNAFLRTFAQRLGNLEAGGLMTADGRWTKQMADRVQAAVFERAYGDRRLTELMAEEADPEIRNILNALNRAAPAFARARAEGGDLGNLNAVTPLVEGIELMREAKRRGQTIESMLGQGDMFGGVPDRTAAMARFLDANRRRPRQLGEALQLLGERIGEEVAQQRNGRLIGEPPTLGELTQAVTAEMQKRYGEGAAAQLSLVAEPGAGFSETGGASRTSETVTGVGEGSQGAAESSTGRVSTRAEPSSSSTTRAAYPPTRQGPATSRGKAAISASITQPQADPVALQGMARQALEGFRRQLGEVERAAGVRLIGARVKEDLGRIQEKGKVKGYDRIYDYLGGRLSADDLPSMLRAINELRERFDVQKYDDFLEVPKNGGYRAVHLEVRLENGLIAEVQVVPRQLAEIQERFHAVYERARKRSLAPHELERLRQDLVTMAEAYGKAFDDFMGRQHLEEKKFDLRQVSPEAFTLADVAPGQLAFDLAPGTRLESGAEQRLKRRVKAVQVGVLRTGITTIKSAADAAHVTAELRKSPQEVMGILVTDINDRVLGFVRIGRGLRGSVSIDTLNLMAALHDIPGASKVWSVHNHPSGSPFHSSADVSMAHKMESMLSMQGYSYLGSVVVAHRSKQTTVFEPRNPRDSVPGRIGKLDLVTPARRQETVPIFETRFRGQPPLGGKGKEIGGPADLVNEIKTTIGNRNGLLLLDNRHRVLDFLELSTDDLIQFFSKPELARRIYERIADSNASSVALRVEPGAHGAGKRFLSEISDSGQLRSLDIVTGDRSLAAAGQMEGGSRYSPSTFYGGIPADLVADSVGRAVRRLGDKLGIPEGKTEIVPPEAAKRPGPLSVFVSPNRIAQKYPIFKPVFDRAQVVQETQERLRKVFRDRARKIDEILGWSATANIPGSPAARRFTENYDRYQAIRLAQDMLGRDFSPAELREMFDASPEIIRALRLTRSAYDHALDLANRVRELRGKAGITRREGYVPHFFHEWMIEVDGKLAYSARTLREAVAMTNDLAREGKQIRIRPKTREFPGGATQAAVLGDRQYFQIQSQIKKGLGLSRAEAEELMQAIASRRGRSRFVGNFLQRRGYEGWERDLRWVDRHYFNMISRYAALDPFKSWSVSYFENKVGGFDKEHRGIEKYLKDFINDVNGNPTHVEDLLNSWIARTPAVGQFLGKYLGDRPALQIAGGITNAVAVAKLGLYNVSSALVNLTQMMNTYALVGERALAGGIARTAAIDSRLAGRALGIRAAEKADRDMGILKQAGVDVQMGLESGAGYSRSAQMGRVFRASTAFFQGVEHNLRRIAVLSAYDKGRREGMNHREAIDYAKEINNRSNFEYGITDAPGFLRRGGPISQVLFQFKKFPIKQMEFMTSLEGMQHARFWIPFLLMSGYFGFPGVELLNNSVRRLFDVDLELELKQALLTWAGEDKDRRAIARTIMYGAFANDSLGGIDVTRRIGGGDFIPSEIDDLWGPFFSSTVRATQLAARDEWVDALRAISTAPGNIAVALRNDGEISNPWQRERVSVRLTPGQQVAKAAGFTTTAESVQRDVYRLAGYETQRFNRQRQEIVDGLIRAARLGEAASVAGNPRGEARAEEQIRKLADRAERLQIPINADLIRREAKLKQMTPAQRAWLGASDIIRARLAPVYEALEPDLEAQDAAGAGQ